MVGEGLRHLMRTLSATPTTTGAYVIDVAGMGCWKMALAHARFVVGTMMMENKLWPYM